MAYCSHCYCQLSLTATAACSAAVPVINDCCTGGSSSSMLGTEEEGAVHLALGVARDPLAVVRENAVGQLLCLQQRIHALTLLPPSLLSSVPLSL